MNWIAPTALSREMTLLFRVATNLIERPLAWAMICLLLAVDFVWARQVGLTIGGSEIAAVSVVALFALSVAYRRRSPAIADMTAVAALWAALMIAGVVLSYLAATCGLPLRDQMLQRLDRLVGFDWFAWNNAILVRPALNWLMIIAYSSMQLQAAFAIIYFTATDRTSRAEELLMLTGATLVLTISLSAIWPALGPFPKDFPYLPDLLALRTGGPWHFELATMQGIVQMPSFHTIMAVLLTYAFRRTGLIGRLIAALNMVMLLSIPPIGGHYLVDMLAGGVIALGAIAVQRRKISGVLPDRKLIPETPACLSLQTPPLKPTDGNFKHGSNLSGNFWPVRLSSQGDQRPRTPPRDDTKSLF